MRCTRDFFFAGSPARRWNALLSGRPARSQLSRQRARSESGARQLTCTSAQRRMHTEHPPLRIPLTNTVYRSRSRPDSAPFQGSATRPDSAPGRVGPRPTQIPRVGWLRPFVCAHLCTSVCICAYLCVLRVLLVLPHLHFSFLPSPIFQPSCPKLSFPKFQN